MSNFLFIDDSGSKQWEVPYSSDFVNSPPAHTEQNRLFWQQNYFVLAGVFINSDSISKLGPIISDEKLKVFGTKRVELHSADIRNPYKLKKCYLEKYSITLDKIREFMDGFWYPLMSRPELQYVAVVVDKRFFRNPRHKGAGPLEMAVGAMFDCAELHPFHDCTIIFDQMDGQINSVKRDQGKILKLSDDRSEYWHAPVRFDCSANSHFLQIADMVAYNVWRQFVDYGDEWDKHVPGEHHKLPMYPYFELIADNFYHLKTGEVSGVGIVKLPDPCNVERGWKLQKTT